ncbi:MAG: hypothetical protein JXB13_11845 [Phycisphaerae bacterium]|nr:hypothetical protein [Phycisphaerae bacterium]
MSTVKHSPTSDMSGAKPSADTDEGTGHPAAPVTAEDTTPYARAGGRGWPAMCLWVFGAKQQRLTYLSLIGPSAASTRFFRINLMLFALAAALFALAHFGWHEVDLDPALAHTGATQPAGHGWVKIVSRPEDAPLRRGVLTPAAVWWNLPQAGIGTAAAFVIACLAGWLLLSVVGRGTSHALSDACREQGRYAAAIRYSSGWVLWLLAAGIVSLLLLPAHVKAVTQSSIAPSRVGVYSAVTVIASVGMLAWWFWLIRSAGTGPGPARTRVVVYFALWMPLTAAAVIVAAVLGLHYGSRWVFGALNLHW